MKKQTDSVAGWIGPQAKMCPFLWEPLNSKPLDLSKDLGAQSAASANEHEAKGKAGGQEAGALMRQVTRCLDWGRRTRRWRQTNSCFNGLPKSEGEGRMAVLHPDSAPTASHKNQNKTGT